MDEKKPGFPPDVEKLFHLLKQQVVDLHAEWKIYLDVFDKENLPLLNATAPSVFQVLLKTLWTSIFMTFCRLTDPANHGKKHENLSVEQLLNRLKAYCPSAFHERLKEQLQTIRKISSPVEFVRKKSLGHYDMTTALTPADLLPKVHREQVQELMDMFADLFNAISIHFTGDQYAFKEVIQRGDGKSLVRFLRRGSEALKEDRQRRAGL